MNDKLGTTIINSNVTISQIAKSTGYSESDILLTIEGVKPINEYLAKHLRSKFNNYCTRFGNSHTAFMYLYTALSSDNKKTLINYILNK